MKKLSYIMCFTLLLVSVLSNCKASNISQQMSDTLQEINRVKFQFYQQTKSLCEFTTDKYTDNYYVLIHYIPKFLEKAYTANTSNNKRISSINELFNLNEVYNNSEYSDINKSPDDANNCELLYNTLVSKNNHQVIQYVNEIFSTRKRIDNLRKIFENLELQKIQQQSHKKHVIKKEKN